MKKLKLIIPVLAIIVVAILSLKSQVEKPKMLTDEYYQYTGDDIDLEDGLDATEEELFTGDNFQLVSSLPGCPGGRKLCLIIISPPAGSANKNTIIAVVNQFIKSSGFPGCGVTFQVVLGGNTYNVTVYCKF